MTNIFLCQALFPVWGALSTDTLMRRRQLFSFNHFYVVQGFSHAKKIVFIRNKAGKAMD